MSDVLGDSHPHQYTVTLTGKPSLARPSRFEVMA